MFVDAKEAHAAGWFSRRHRTNEAHVAANAGRDRRTRKATKRAEAEARNAVTKHERTRAFRRSQDAS